VSYYISLPALENMNVADIQQTSPPPTLAPRAATVDPLDDPGDIGYYYSQARMVIPMVSKN
jgi:hypothetical protein